MMYCAKFYEVSKCFEEATGREWAVRYQLEEVPPIIDSDTNVI